MVDLLFLILLIGSLFLGLRLYAYNTRKQIIFKLLERYVLENRSLQTWYSSKEILQLARKLNKKTKPELQVIFENLKKQNLSILAQLSPKPEVKLICETKKRIEDTLISAELNTLKFNYNAASKYIKNYTPKTKDEIARKLIVEAKIALNEGDMETASLSTAKAIKIFQKLNFCYEEACAYLLYGTIYRATGIVDTAQIMLQTAFDIFDGIDAKIAKAEALGNIGMLLVMGNRFDEANDYFEKAIDICKHANNFGEIVNIYNQQALMLLITNKISDAEQRIKHALSLCPHKNLRAMALSYDIYAQIAMAKNQLRKTKSLAHKALLLYQKSNNISAEIEMMYLTAQAQIKQKMLEAAEKKLREIIKKSTMQASCFHVANAYNLLGLIYLQKNDFSRAKGLFNQSLSSELSNERWCGVAIDYANIALTEYRKGCMEEAKKNIKAALEYAKESGDETLLKKLNNAFKNF